MSDPVTIEEIDVQAFQSSVPQNPSGSTGILSDSSVAALNSALNTYRAESGLSEFLANASSGPTGYARRPFIFTRIGEKERGELIYAALNPEDIQISIRTREVIEKTGGGEVKHVARFDPDRSGRLGRYIDEIPVRYTISSGNCLPLRMSNGDIKIPPGLNVMYALFQLILESDRILPDGRANDFIVVQNTVQFPEMIFEGKIDPEGVSWTHSANEPNIMNISFTLNVHTTIPRMTSYSELIATYNANSPAIGRR